MLFSLGPSHHRNHECIFPCQLYYDQKRKKHQHCIYICLVQVFAIQECKYDLVVGEAALRLSWRLFSSPTQASNLLAYGQHVQLLSHLLHELVATILNTCASHDSTCWLQKWGIVSVVVLVEYKRPHRPTHYTNSKCALQCSINLFCATPEQPMNI